MGRPRKLPPRKVHRTFAMTEDLATKVRELAEVYPGSQNDLLEELFMARWNQQFGAQGGQQGGAKPPGTPPPGGPGGAVGFVADTVSPSTSVKEDIQNARECASDAWCSAQQAQALLDGVLKALD